jgi:hypothetical protein
MAGTITIPHEVYGFEYDVSQGALEEVRGLLVPLHDGTITDPADSIAVMGHLSDSLVAAGIQRTFNDIYHGLSVLILTATYDKAFAHPKHVGGFDYPEHVQRNMQNFEKRYTRPMHTFVNGALSGDAEAIRRTPEHWREVFDPRLRRIPRLGQFHTGMNGHINGDLWRSMDDTNREYKALVECDETYEKYREYIDLGELYRPDFDNIQPYIARATEEFWAIVTPKIPMLGIAEKLLQRLVVAEIGYQRGEAWSIAQLLGKYAVDSPEYEQIVTAQIAQTAREIRITKAGFGVVSAPEKLPSDVYHFGKKMSRRAVSTGISIGQQLVQTVYTGASNLADRVAT